MASVGDFTPTETTDPDADPDTFEFFGETFDVPANVGSFALLRYGSLMKGAQAQETRGGTMKRRAAGNPLMLEAANRELALAELSAHAAIYELLKASLGDGQLERFGEIADANGTTFNGLMEVAGDITEVIAGRPTRRSSDSSDGPSTTGTASTGDGSGPTEMSPRDQQVAAIEAASTSLVDSPSFP